MAEKGRSIKLKQQTILHMYIYFWNYLEFLEFLFNDNKCT